jgi:hypothetical protein
MFIPDPNIFPSRIPGSGIQQKRGGEKYICCPNFFVAIKINKILKILTGTEKDLSQW